MHAYLPQDYHSKAASGHGQGRDVADALFQAVQVDVPRFGGGFDFDVGW
jgi:hypothetical protein